MDGMNDAVDTSADVGGGADTAVMDAPDNGSDDSNYAAMQDRMAGDDSPWYSHSEGKVVDADGKVITDPATGDHFKSQEEFDQWQAKQQAASTATPKTEPVADKPMARSFDRYLSEDGNVSADTLFGLSKVADQFNYNNELVPQVVETPAQQQAQPETVLDPILQADAKKAELTKLHVDPIVGIFNDLIANGASEDVAKSICDKYYRSALAKVDGEYKQLYDKAMRDSIDAKTKPVLDQVAEKELMAKSESNVTKIANALYPKGGKDQFFSLINGHYDEKGAFQRGPSADVLDFAVALANEFANKGEPFKSQDDRSKFMAKVFGVISSKENMLPNFARIAHFSYLGKNVNKAFDKGKQSAAQDSQRIQRTVKTRPASFVPPNMDDDDKGMPDLMRTVLRANSR
jgi:hypothetical protein